MRSETTPKIWLIRALTLSATVGLAIWLIVDTQQFANSTVAPSEHAMPATGADTDLVHPTDDASKGGASESGLSDAPFFGPSTKSTIGIGGSAGGAYPGRGGGRDLKGK